MDISTYHPQISSNLSSSIAQISSNSPKKYQVGEFILKYSENIRWIVAPTVALDDFSRSRDRHAAEGTAWGGTATERGGGVWTWAVEAGFCWTNFHGKATRTGSYHGMKPRKQRMTDLVSRCSWLQLGNSLSKGEGGSWSKSQKFEFERGGSEQDG